MEERVMLTDAEKQAARGARYIGRTWGSEKDGL
jgi:hypothetical protein